MPTPANRAKIQLVRGSYANILASIADLVDGELCYAKDQNKLYMVEGSTLTTLDYLANTDITETVQDAIGAAISGGVGLTSVYNDTTGLTTIDLDNTAVTAGTYGSASAIPAVTVDQQGRITSITTNSVGVDLGVSADAGTSQFINLLTETLAISGADGITTTTTTNGVSIDLDNTAVTAGTYGSSTEIPSIIIDQQGRITSATTNTVSTDLVVAADVGTNQTISLGTETLTISGADGITTTATTNNISIDLDNTAVTPATYGDGDTVGQFIVDQQGRITSATDVNISIAHTAISDWATAVRGTTGIDQTGEPMGHAARLDSTISFNVSTRTFSIAPVGANYVVWCKGVKFIKTTTSTLVLPNTTGLYYIYFDPAGALQFRTSYFDWENDAPTAYIYWNATTGTAPYFADERHGITLDWATHEYLHRTRGAVIANGFSISNFTIAGSGAIDSDCHVDIAGGTFFDEDLEVIIVQSNSPAANTWEQDLAGPAQIPVIYLDGTAWRKDAATNFPFKQGSVRPQYNSYNSGAGTWSTVDAGNNKFIVQFVVATHSLGSPVLAVMGQGYYTNLGDAEAVDFNGLTLSDFPSVEFRPLYKLIYQVGSYANSVNARLRSVIDIRQISSSGVGQALGSDHGNLSGLGDDDHLQYLHSTNNRTGVTADIATSGALSTTNATVSTSSGTGALTVTGGVGVGGNVNIAGSLTVAGTTVTLDAETLLIEDKSIEMGVVATPSDATADGGGITLKGTTDKTINWVDATDAWTFSEHVNIASAKEYRIAGTKVLDATSLGSAVVGSSLTSVGTIGTGVWQGTAIADTYLGTISTALKVSNSATTATNANTASAIVARDASGNFTAGTITAALTGTASGNLVSGGALGTPSSGTLTNCTFPTLNQSTTGNAATVTTNANLTGDITSIGNATTIAAGVIVDADVNASAAIVDTKLATISTAGKVSNSATTAASANTASAIVARDASGNFTAGTITAALTGAASSNVLKAGDTMTGALVVPLASAVTPSLTFTGDLDTGVFSPGANQVAVATNGVERVKFGTAEVVFNDGGTDYDFRVEGDTSSHLLFVDASTDRVGIGTSSPVYKLDVVVESNKGIGAFAPASSAGITDFSAGGVGWTFTRPNGVYTHSMYSYDTSAGAKNNFVIQSRNDIVFINGGSPTTSTETMRIVEGKVGIGVTSPAQALEVNGSIQVGDTGASAARIDFGSASTRIQHDGADNLSVYSNGSERARIDSNGKLLVGTSTARANFNNSTESAALQLEGTDANRRLSITGADNGAVAILARQRSGAVGGNTIVQSGDIIGVVRFEGSDGSEFVQAAGIQCEVDGTPGANDMPGRLVFSTATDASPSVMTERMRIDSAGRIMIPNGVSTTPEDNTGTNGITLACTSGSYAQFAKLAGSVASFNRMTDDGTIISLRQAGTEEGNINVSGSNVALTGAHLSRWSQLPGGADRIEILRGSVLSNLDEMCEWGEEDNEQLNRMKVSTVEGDKNVSGVFQSWDDDDDTYTNDFYCAMTGDFIIRIAAGITIERGDLLMSAGDGTAKPQDNDIIRSKTIAKVTSTNVTCTYDDGSYCVPCVLMAC